MAYVESHYLELNSNKFGKTPPKISQLTKMAYVESHYLGLNAEPDVIDNVDAHNAQQVEPKFSDDSQKAMPKSDYCGFEGDGIPPVYRAQLPVSEKTKLSTAEPKSSYIYGKDEKEKSMSEEKIAPIDAQSVEYHAPRFSPPPQNDAEEFQKRLDFSLPKIQAVEATEHVFDIKGKHEASQYVLMKNEDPIKVNKKTDENSMKTNCGILRETDDGEVIISYDKGKRFFFLSEKELEDEKKGKKVVRENKKEEKKEEKSAKKMVEVKKEKKKDEKTSKHKVEKKKEKKKEEKTSKHKVEKKKEKKKEEKTSKHKVEKKKEKKKEEKTSKQKVEVKKEEKKEEKTSKQKVEKEKEEKNTMNGFRIHKVIGTGSFGTVRLVEKKGKFFAMKSIKTNQTTGKLDCDEVEILKDLKHPFISSLFSHFNNNGELHVVMEFVEGGDLDSHLVKTPNGFDRDQIKYFASSIVLAVGYLHEQLIVHRDLKPKNIMITRQGHLKVIDFGLSKKLTKRGDKMHDRVGTAAYSSPEVHNGEIYGIDMDWFSVGVSLFELRTLQLPLTAGFELLLMHPRISDWPEFEDLLFKLTAFQPEERLGYESTKQVKDHKFFTGMDFGAVLNLSMRPPYVPKMVCSILAFLKF
ncbi:hypothetical protein CRE_25642 [Caenorhabditis remanei]|uniref:Protein kinase domain-containing protein n=1 Tax=Caenorhabditis remanei TaxID=31234 RepID=E3ML65_CAERE|nr:hypothetical protein CRE_25642 [Caenorhabditis remanei]